MDTETKYILHYFPLYGRAEPQRLLLSHANVPYVNNLITFADWPALKETMPGGCMPCLEFPDGKKMGETKDIMKFLGKTHGYYPKDEETDKKSDDLIDIFYELYPATRDIYSCSDADLKASRAEEFFTNILPTFMA